MGEALLPEYVLVAVVTVIAARCAPATAITVCERLLRAREITFVPCSPHFHASVATFRDVAAAGLSFADATIVTIARSRGASEIATFDGDFAKVHGVTLVP